MKIHIYENFVNARAAKSETLTWRIFVRFVKVCLSGPISEPELDVLCLKTISYDSLSQHQSFIAWALILVFSFPLQPFHVYSVIIGASQCRVLQAGYAEEQEEEEQEEGEMRLWDSSRCCIVNNASQLSAFRWVAKWKSAKQLSIWAHTDPAI